MTAVNCSRSNNSVPVIIGEFTAWLAQSLFFLKVKDFLEQYC